MEFDEDDPKFQSDAYIREKKVHKPPLYRVIGLKTITEKWSERVRLLVEDCRTLEDRELFPSSVQDRYELVKAAPQGVV